MNVVKKFVLLAFVVAAVCVQAATEMGDSIEWTYEVNDGKANIVTVLVCLLP